MKRQIALFSLVLLALAVVAVSSQEIDPVARANRWREFNKYGFDKMDFAKLRLTKAKVANLKEDENAD
ncbi:MAG TPA: hypothetical protein VGJ02_05185, partial [Pyrinomonadaceae bacterium]